MATVTLKGIQKDYGAVQVIKGVDLSIDDREFCVFVGPSGCGKSTLLRMIAGLEEISAGDLMIDGQRVNDVPPSERGLAMVFQSYALYPHMSVADNMGFSLRLAGASKEERRAKVAEAARILHLDAFLDRKPKELSGGQRQRVAIGRAIVRKPKVFLFDEPLSNLDAALRVQMRIELARLHDELGGNDDLRDPRSGRGHDHGRQDRGAAGRNHRAGRHAARIVSSSAQPVRGGIHRQPQDELSAGQGDGNRRGGHHRSTGQRRYAGRPRSRRPPEGRRVPSRWAFGRSICGWGRRAKSPARSRLWRGSAARRSSIRSLRMGRW